MDQKKIPKGRKTTHITDKELAMLRKTTHLTDKELIAWHTEFLRECPTGKLDKDIFINSYKKLCPKDAPTAACNIFDWLDKNSDGTVDFNEFLFTYAVNSSGIFDDRLELIFNVWDVSEDGRLDQFELAHLISAMYDRARVKDRQNDNNPQTRAKAIITKLDIDGDRKISRDEFIKGCKTDEVIAKLLAPNP